MVDLEIVGSWISGPSVGLQVRVCGYRAGLLVTLDANDQEISGRPNCFLSNGGEDGTTLVIRHCVSPSVEQLRYGTMREAIAAVYLVALYGFGESRAWDNANDYIVADGCGSYAVVRFGSGSSCVGVAISNNPRREYDLERASFDAPFEMRGIISDLLRLPLLVGHLPVTSVFWGANNIISGAEPWPTLYAFGGELLEKEMMTDDDWVAETQDELPGATIALVTSIARRVIRGDSVEPSLWSNLVPTNAEYSQKALHLLEELKRVAGDFASTS